MASTLINPKKNVNVADPERLSQNNQRFNLPKLHLSPKRRREEGHAKNQLQILFQNALQKVWSLRNWKRRQKLWRRLKKSSSCPRRGKCPKSLPLIRSNQKQSPSDNARQKHLWNQSQKNLILSKTMRRMQVYTKISLNHYRRQRKKERKDRKNLKRFA